MRGRPLVEGERRSVQIKVRVTPTMEAWIDEARGEMSRQDWIRRQIMTGVQANRLARAIKEGFK